MVQGRRQVCEGSSRCIRNGCAQSWQVWRSDAPLVGARTTLRKDDRVRLKRAVSLNGGAVVVAAGREGVVTRPPRGKACVRVQVGDNEWSEDEADDVLELLGGQRPYSAALPGPNPGRSISKEWWGAPGGNSPGSTRKSTRKSTGFTG
eukprot:gene13360-biopygen12962